MFRRSWLAPIAALAIAGCAEANVGCTLIGCDSGVSFTFGDLGPAAIGTLNVHACVDSVCTDVVGPREFTQITTEETGPRTAIVTVTITADGTVLVQDSMPVDLVKSMPNGERCEPTCYQAGVTVTADGLALTS